MEPLRTRGGRVFDGKQLRPEQSLDVVVNDGRIESVGPAATRRDTEGTVIDARGLTVLPGLIDAPRLLVAGRALSQTGGHGDMRPADTVALCGCGYSGALSAVVDGADEMRVAVRGDPLSDIGLMAHPNSHLVRVVLGGRVILDRTQRSPK